MLSVSLFDFAGLDTPGVDLGRSSVIVWENGSGKSKILEALIFLMNGIPVRERSPREYISWQSDHHSQGYGISCRFASDLLDEVYTIEMHTAKLWYFHQGQSISRMKYLDLMPYRALLFHPAEMNIVYGSPSLRRHYVDTTLQLSRREAHRVIREYDQALRSRNALLKSLRNRTASTLSDLDLWDALYIERSYTLMQLRKSFLQDCQPADGELAALIGKNIPGLRLEGKGVSFASIDRDEFARELRSHRDKDIVLGHTSYGPQYDDFDFLIGSKDEPISTRDFLSRGENKTLLLYLKAKQMQHIQKERPDKSLVLLFDDIFAELDAAHVSRVIELHKEFPTVYTAAQLESIPLHLRDSLVYINI